MKIFSPLFVFQDGEEEGDAKGESDEVKENGVYPPVAGEVGRTRHENNSTVNSDNSSDMFDSEKVKSTAARSVRSTSSCPVKLKLGISQ